MTKVTWFKQATQSELWQQVERAIDECQRAQHEQDKDILERNHKLLEKLGKELRQRVNL